MASQKQQLVNRAPEGDELPLNVNELQYNQLSAALVVDSSHSFKGFSRAEIKKIQQSSELAQEMVWAAITLLGDSQADIDQWWIQGGRQHRRKLLSKYREIQSRFASGIDFVKGAYPGARAYTRRDKPNNVYVTDLGLQLSLRQLAISIAHEVAHLVGAEDMIFFYGDKSVRRHLGTNEPITDQVMFQNADTWAEFVAVAHQIYERSQATRHLQQCTIAGVTFHLRNASKHDLARFKIHHSAMFRALRNLAKAGQAGSGRTIQEREDIYWVSKAPRLFEMLAGKYNTVEFTKMMGTTATGEDGTMYMSIADWKRSASKQEYCEPLNVVDEIAAQELGSHYGPFARPLSEYLLEHK